MSVRATRREKIASGKLNWIGAGLVVFAIIGAAPVGHAQSAADTQLYTLVNDAGTSEALYRSANGQLIFRRNQTNASDERGDSTYYLRETWSPSAMLSVSLDSSFDFVDNVVITIKTRPDAVYREHFDGGQMYTHQTTDETLEFPKADAAIANRVLSQLKSMAGR